MYADIYCCSIHFLTLDAFNVNNVLLPIDLYDLADLLALVVTTHDLPHRHVCIHHLICLE